MAVKESSAFLIVFWQRERRDDVYVVCVCLGTSFISSGLSIPVVKGEEFDDQHVGWRRHIRQDRRLRRIGGQSSQIHCSEVLFDETSFRCDVPMEFRPDELDPAAFRDNAVYGWCQDVQLLDRLFDKPEVLSIFTWIILQLVNYQFGDRASFGFVKSLRAGNHQVDVGRSPNVLGPIPEKQVDAQAPTDEGFQTDSVEGLREFEQLAEYNAIHAGTLEECAIAGRQQPWVPEVCQSSFQDTAPHHPQRVGRSQSAC